MGLAALSSCDVFFSLDVNPVAIDGQVCAADLDNDPQNCGRCGHDCLRGACTSGACQPFALATMQAQPLHIAIDGAYGYYFSTSPNGTDGTVMRIAR
jgi:hypothetical protein